MTLANLLLFVGLVALTAGKPLAALPANVQGSSSPVNFTTSGPASANPEPGVPNASPVPVHKGAKTKNAKETAPQTLIGIVEWEYKPLAWDCDVPNCDHFAIYDDATHRNYEIDDARAALPFEGKRAKISGVVDDKNSVVHLLSIQSAPQ